MTQWQRNTQQGKIGLSSKTTNWLRRAIFRSEASFLVILVIFQWIIAPGLSPVIAAPEDDFENLLRQNGPSMERYYDRAEDSADEQQWDEIVERGRVIQIGSWEAILDREIQNRVNSDPAADEVELEEAATLVQAQWEQQLEDEMEERRGEWRARNLTRESPGLQDLLNAIDTQGLASILDEAGRQPLDPDFTTREKLESWDDYVQPRVALLRQDWESQMDALYAGLQTAVSLSGDERDAFEAELANLRGQTQQYYNQEESNLISAFRTQVLSRENRLADLDNSVADETDPDELAQLLIQRTRLSIRQSGGEIIIPDRDLIRVGLGTDINAESFNEEAIRAFEAGQKQWNKAIQDLIVQKLKYDQQAERERRAGEAQWEDAYQTLLQERDSWNAEIEDQIQEGLNAWEQAEADFGDNRALAEEELGKYLQQRQKEWDDHLGGLQSVILDGSGTIETAVNNRLWYDDAIKRIQANSSIVPNAAETITLYEQERTRWQTIENDLRQLVRDSLSRVHDGDMRGENGVNGPGLLDENSDTRVLTSAELELQIAEKELAYYQNRKENAQQVYDSLLASDGMTPEEVSVELEAARTSYRDQEQTYLDLLAELNGGVSQATDSVDLSGEDGTSADTPDAGTTLQDELDAAAEEAAEKRAALAKAQKDLNQAQAAYERAMKLQVLVQNPDLLGDIGSLPGDTDFGEEGKTDPGLRGEIESAQKSIDQAQEKVRQNQREVNRLKYEEANANRAIDFFKDLFSRIKSFENLKEEHAAFIDELDAEASLLGKLDILLDPGSEILAGLYGNERSEEIKDELQAIQDSMPELETNVQDSVARLDPELTGLEAPVSNLETTFQDPLNEDTAFANGVADLVQFISGQPDLVASTETGAQVSSVLAAYNAQVNEKDNQVQDLTDARQEFQTILQDYRDTLAAHSGDAQNIEVQKAIVALKGGYQKYLSQVSTFQAYLSNLDQYRNTLINLSQQLVLQASSEIDATMYGDERTNLRSDLSTLQSNLHSARQALNTAAQQAWAPFDAVNTAFEKASTALSDYTNDREAERNKLLEAYAKIDKIEKSLASSRDSQQAQISFLLDSEAGDEELESIEKALQNDGMTRAAQINLRATQILSAALVDDAPESVSVAILNLEQQLLENLDDLEIGDSSQRIDIEAIQLAMQFLKGNQAGLETELADNPSDLADELSSMQDRAQLVADFYAAGAELTEAERNTLRNSSDADDRMLLNEYYNPGSTFGFQAILSQMKEQNQAEAQFARFKEGIQTGAILHSALDQELAAQEDSIDGLLVALQNEVPALAGITASELYNDSRPPGEPDLDTDATEVKQNLYADLIGAETNLEALLGIVGDTDTLSANFSSTNVVAILSEVQKVTNTMEGLEADELAALQRIQPVAQTLYDQAPDAEVVLRDGIQNLTDSALSGLAAFLSLESSFPIAAPPGTDANGDPFLSPYQELSNARLKANILWSDWDAKQATFASAVSDFETASASYLQALSTYEPGSPEWIQATDDFTLAAGEFSLAFNKARQYRSDISDALNEADTIARTITRTIIEDAVQNGEISPDPSWKYVVHENDITPDLNDSITANRDDYVIIRNSDSNVLQDLAQASYQWGNRTAALELEVQTSDAQTLEEFENNMATLSQRILNLQAAVSAREDYRDEAVDALRNDVPNAIRVMTVPVGPNEIDDHELVSMADGILMALQKKSLNGEQFNESLLANIQEVKAYTDEIDNLLYFKNYPDGQEAKDQLDDLETKKETLKELEADVAGLKRSLESLQNSGAPLHQSMDQVQAIVQKWNSIEEKSDGVRSIPSDIEDAVLELKDRAWSAHKRNIAMAFLQTQHGYGTLDDYMEAVASNQPILAGAQNPKQPVKAAKFLGTDLTQDQLDELRAFLVPYYEKSLLEKTGLVAQLDNYVATRDPALQSELYEFGLMEAFDRVQNGLQNGFVHPGTMPEALRDYTLAASFTSFLENQEDLNVTVAADREVGKFRFLDQTGGNTQWADFLNDYLANFDSRNASYYLPEELKELHAYQSVFFSDYTEGLDMAGLSQWLLDKKYEPEVQQSAENAARMRFAQENYSGEGLDEYFSWVDSRLSAAGLSGFSDAEKDDFELSIAGVKSPFELASLAKDIQAQHFTEEKVNQDTLSDALSALAEETENLLEANFQAERDYRREKYVADVQAGAILIESHLSYEAEDIGPDGLAKVEQDTQVANRIKELERQAEHELGAFVSLLETYRSHAYDPDKDEFLSISKTADDVASAYSADKTVHTSDGQGVYAFEADLNNTQQKLEQYRNVNQPGFLTDDPYATVSAARAEMAGLKDTVLQAGETIVQITYANSIGLDAREELERTVTEYETRQTTLNTAQTEYNNAQQALDTAQIAYNDKQQETQDAYEALKEAEKELNRVQGLYDSALILDYAKDVETDSETSDPLAVAKEHLDQAKADYSEKLEGVEALRTKVANQIKIDELGLDAKTVQIAQDLNLSREEAREWALRAMRYSEAEQAIKAEVAARRERVRAAESALKSSMGRLMPYQAPPYATLEGYRDYNSNKYLRTEQLMRSMFQIADGIRLGQLGMWDFMVPHDAATRLVAYPSASQNSGPTVLEQDVWGQDLKNLLPNKSPADFLAKYGTGQPGAEGDALQKATLTWFWTRYDWAGAEFSRRREQAGTNYAAYDQLMHEWAALEIIKMANIANVLGALNPQVGVYMFQRNNQFTDAKAALYSLVGTANQNAQELTEAQQSLQELTDITSVTQLKSVLQDVGGLSDDDLAFIQTDGNGNGLENLEYVGGKKTLGFDEIAGRDGEAAVQQRAIHDQYGLFVREGEPPVGATTGDINGDTDKYGRVTRLMVSADEFADALSVTARTQYEIERDEYYETAENITVGSVSIERLEVLDDREQFFADLFEEAENQMGEGFMQNAMFRDLIDDYMGSDGVVSEIHSMYQSQQKTLNLAEWDQRQVQLSDKKDQWLKRVNYLKDVGQTRFSNMVEEFNQNRNDWRQDFNARVDANRQKYLDEIEKTIEDQQKWAEAFRAEMRKKSDKRNLRELYDGIQSELNTIRKNLPGSTPLNVNANDILAQVLAKKPETLDESILDAGKYVNTQAFIEQMESLDLISAELDQYEAVVTEMEDAQKRLTVLQTLDGILTLPQTYKEIIAQANKGLHKELENKLVPDGFIKNGNVFGRYATTPESLKSGTGQTLQILPDYADFIYTPPTEFPAVKDASGRSWDMSDVNALVGEDAPSAAELKAMTRLVKTAMDQEFAKVYVAKRTENYEDEMAAFGGRRGLTAYVQQVTGATVSTLQKGGELTGNEGLTVGLVEGGTFGRHHFDEFYRILKLKEYYDKQKTAGEAKKNSGHYKMGRGLGDYMELTSGGLIDSDTIAGAFYDNRDAIDTVMDVAVAAAAIVAGLFTAGAGTAAIMGAYSGYKMTLGAYEGGALGAIAGAASIVNSFTPGVALDMSYSYENGFSGQVGFGVGKAGTVGLSYSDQAGFGASVGMNLDGALNLGLNYSESGGFGINAGFEVNNANVGLSYSDTGGYGASISQKNGFGVKYSRDRGVSVLYSNTFGDPKKSPALLSSTLDYSLKKRDVRADISARYNDTTKTQNSRFWNQSGMDLSIGKEGYEVSGVFRGDKIGTYAMDYANGGGLQMNTGNLPFQTKMALIKMEQQKELQKMEEERGGYILSLLSETKLLSAFTEAQTPEAKKAILEKAAKEREKNSEAEGKSSEDASETVESSWTDGWFGLKKPGTTSRMALLIPLAWVTRAAMSRKWMANSRSGCAS